MSATIATGDREVIDLDQDSLDGSARVMAHSGRRWPGAAPRPGLPPRGCDRGKGVHTSGRQRGFFTVARPSGGGWGTCDQRRTVMTRARALKASHPCSCRKDRRTLHHCSPSRSEGTRTASAPVVRTACSPRRHRKHAPRPRRSRRADSPTRRRSRRPARDSTTGSPCSIGSAAPRGATPPGASPLRRPRVARLVLAGDHGGVRTRARRARCQSALRRRVRGVGLEGGERDDGRRGQGADGDARGEALDRRMSSPRS